MNKVNHTKGGHTNTSGHHNTSQHEIDVEHTTFACVICVGIFFLLMWDAVWRKYKVVNVISIIYMYHEVNVRVMVHAKVRRK